jgi:type VI secretion system secreted protein Hcp
MNYAHLKQVTLASAIAVACTLPIAEDAWAPVFAKYDGVDGESKDSKHKGEIDVLSWSWGMSGDEDGSGPPCAKELVLTKNIDSATPGLVNVARVGTLPNKDIPEFLILTVEQKKGQTYTLDFSKPGVKAIHQSNRGAGDRPTEEVAFYYSEVQLTYGRQDPVLVPEGCSRVPTGGD